MGLLARGLYPRLCIFCQKHRDSGFDSRMSQPCLGGDGKTLMFVNINCEPASVKETLCSLRFAAKVNQCETGAKGGARKHITELPSDPTTRTAQPGTAEVHAIAECTVWICVLVFLHLTCIKTYTFCTALTYPQLGGLCLLLIQ